MENRDAFFYSRVLFWGFGLSLIMNVAGTGFWISELLGAIISFFILLSVKKVNESKVVKLISGTVFAFLATIIIANLGGTMYLKNTPNSILAFFPLIVGFIVSLSSKNAFKRTIFILFAFSMLLFVDASAILIYNAKLENILPLSFNVRNILEGTIIFVLTSVTPVLCLNDFKEKKSLMINYVSSTITVIVMSLLVMMVLGSQEAMLYRYPEFILLKRIRIYEFFSNVENLFVIMIATDFITTIASGFRRMDIKGKVKPAIVISAIWIASTIACSHGSTMTLMYKYYPFLLFFLCFLTLFPKK